MSHPIKAPNPPLHDPHALPHTTYPPPKLFSVFFTSLSLSLFLLLSISHPTIMAFEQAVVKTPVTLSKYSNRVSLKTIVGSSDGGLGLVGKRVVIGGWVKSSNEAAPPGEVPPEGRGAKDVGCVEVLPFFRSIMKVLGGSHHPIHAKLDAVLLPKLPPPPFIAILQVSDGSCVATLQVMVDSSIVHPSQVMPTGTCIVVKGTLQQPAVEGKHGIELKVEKVMHVGVVDQDKYPLSRKRLPLEMFVGKI